jgi:PEP-CTERM motif
MFTARYVRMEQISRFPNAFTPYGAGLAEIRFDGVLTIPEPANLALLVLGLIVLVARRRQVH